MHMKAEDGWLSSIALIMLCLKIFNSIYLQSHSLFSKKTVQAASEKAKEAAENVKQILEVSPPRIELDVELEAPMIVVPRLSSSPDVIVALLGNVSVKNKITGHKDHKKAVLDRMEIQLTEMALSMLVFPHFQK